MTREVPDVGGLTTEESERMESLSYAPAATPAPTAAPKGATPTIVVACLAVTMLMLDISVVNTALSDIASSLNTSLSGLQWVIDAYTLPLAATVLTFGALADRHGRRKLFLGGLSLFVIASAACATAGTIEALVASRAIQGLGAAVMFATALALIAQVSPTPELRNKALAAFGASIGIAFAIGPFVGGGLTELFGWRAIFWINAPVGLAALFVAWTRVGEGRDEHARAVDWPGQVALIGGMFLLILGLLRANADGWGSPGIVAALAGSVVLLGAFITIQVRSKTPMLPLHLLKRPRFAAPQIAVVGISASFFALFLYITLYMQGVLGLSPIETGLAYLPGTGLMFIVAGAAAQIMGRVSPARLTVVGLLLIAIGLALIPPLAHVGSPWTSLLPATLIASLGTGLFNPAASELALQALPENQSGLASGANDLFRQTGVAVGIALLGTLVPAGGTFGVDPQAYVDGFHNAALVAAGIALVGAIGAGILLSRPSATAPQKN
jgi:EmrB/QacA subfamily drug resistance transporter